MRHKHLAYGTVAREKRFNPRYARGQRFSGTLEPLLVCGCTLGRWLELRRAILWCTKNTGPGLLTWPVLPGPHIMHGRSRSTLLKFWVLRAMASGIGVSDQYRPIMMTDDLRGLPDTWLCIMLWDFSKTLKKKTPQKWLDVNYSTIPVNVDS